jgi:hypothetical protein
MGYANRVNDEAVNPVVRMNLKNSKESFNLEITLQKQSGANFVRNLLRQMDQEC